MFTNNAPQVPLLEFLALRDVAMIDGKLYFTQTGADRYHPRGKANYATIEAENETILLHSSSSAIQYPIDQQVFALGDVGIIEGAGAANHLERIGTSQVMPFGNWHRRYYELRRGLPIDLLAIDYKLVKSPSGRKLKSTGEWAVPPSLETVAALPEFNIEKSYLFTFANLSIMGKPDVLVMHDDSVLVRSGPKLLFTDYDLSQRHRDFV